MRLLERRVQKFSDREVVGRMDARRKEGEEISSAHNESNLRMTAHLTQLVGELYDFTPKERKLAYLAASLHDIKRSPREGASRDEEDSADIARAVMRHFKKRFVFWTSQEEQHAVTFAIENHSTAPASLKNPDTRNREPQTLDEKIQMALFVADKMTANGFDVLRRRPAFVAGERLHDSAGDLREFGFAPNRDEALVVAMESAIRLGFINPESIYPDKLQPLVGPLYEIQREFVRGVFKDNNLHNRDIAEFLLGRDPVTGADRKRFDGKSMAEVRKLAVPSDSASLAKLLAEKTGITDEAIDATPDAVAEGARETLTYFSSHYKTDLDELTQKWEPQTPVAQRWQKGMRDYMNGTVQ